MALAVLCVVSCAKPKQSVDPVINNNENSETPTTGGGPDNFPFSFQPDEPISGYVLELEYNSSISDYANIIKAKLNEIADHGGGTLIVPYGEYPLRSDMIFERHTGPAFAVAIVGIRSENGEFPLFYDRDQSKKPHQFFSFQSNWNTPQMSFSVRNLRFEGNNHPYSPSHPFYGSGAVPRPCISGKNVATGTVKNVIISNIYGDGIFFVNGGANGKNTRIESVVIKSCKILNCWSDNLLNNTGDGIMLWSCNKPLVEGCIISNDVNVTKHYSRGGIILEHGAEKAIIKNCFIQGYQRNIHIECDYGGHLITNNKIYRNSKVGIVFSEDCGQDINEQTDYSPSKVINNEFLYDQNYLEYNANHATFIYIYKKSFVLNGLEIKDNTFHFKEKNSPPDRAQYLKFSHPFNVYIQTHGQENVTISNNQYN